MMKKIGIILPLLVTLLSGCGETASNSAETTQCPSACPETCDENGKCPEIETNTCPDACPNDCNEDGNCPEIETNTCPDACPNDCDDDGECSKSECPEECPETCDNKGKCPDDKPNACPEECPESCDKSTQECPTDETDICPDECPDGCDESGKCLDECPEECPENCLDGECLVECPDECPDTCDDSGKCIDKCPEGCPETCDKTTLQCPDLCPSDCPRDCDEETLKCYVTCPKECADSCNRITGICPCEPSCKTSCNKLGVCQCPDSCAKTCNDKGECPGYCGDEAVKKIYFAVSESDLLPPGSENRTSTTIKLYIKTSAKTYNAKTFPCADELVIEPKDSTIISAAKSGTGVKFASKKVGASEVKVSYKTQPSLTATHKVYVLNLNNLTKDLTSKNIHPAANLKVGLNYKRGIQGFDFFNTGERTDFFYSQGIGKFTTSDGQSGDKKTIAIQRVVNGKTAPSYEMKLYGTGHGQNLYIENVKGTPYVWLSNYGKLDSENLSSGYASSQTVARIKMQNGKSFTPKEVTDQYYLSDITGKSKFGNFEMALDQANDRFLIRAYYSGTDTETYKGKGTYYNIYDFSKVKALTAEETTLATKITTLDDFTSDKPKLLKDQTIKVKVKDLAKLTPLYSFKAKSSMQGIAIHNGLVYTVQSYGNSKYESSDNYATHFYIRVRVYTYSGTRIGSYDIGPFPSCEKCSDYSTNCEKSENICYLDNEKFAKMLNYTDSDGTKYQHTGHIEAEAIHVSEGKLYISLFVTYKNAKGGSAIRYPVVSFDLLK